MDETLEFALLVRLQDVLAGAPATETDLRTLAEQGGAWARTLGAQLRASEERLAALARDRTGSLAGMAQELRRIEQLRPELERLRAQLDALELRARELRTQWLREQAHSGPPAGR